jgi:iron complex transport system ATP-binding protein
MSDAQLVVENLRVEHGGRAVVAGVSFAAERGEVLAVLGPNGAGKSSLLRAVAGLVPHEGRVVIAGREAATLSRLEHARALTYLPQRSLLASPLPAATVVAHGRYAYAPGFGRLTDADRTAIGRAMETTGVSHLAYQPFTRLSYGEQRRVLLARSLATGAGILFLDEPAASLDVAHALALFRTLRARADAGDTVAVAVHQLDDARRFADRALLLQEGRLIAHGAVKAVLAPEHVLRVYGVELHEREALGFRLPTQVPP